MGGIEPLSVAYILYAPSSRLRSLPAASVPPLPRTCSALASRGSIPVLLKLQKCVLEMGGIEPPSGYVKQVHLQV